MFASKKRGKITVASTISGSGLVKAGGSNVINGLYTRLAEYFDIEIIYIAPINEQRRCYEIVPGLIENVIPKTNAHIEKERILTRQLNAQTTYDLSLLYFLDETPEYGECLKRSIKDSDVVITDRPYLYHEVKKYLNGRPLFQRSHNIEYIYRRANIPCSEEREQVLTDLFMTEKECSENCLINFVCSEEDMTSMHDMYDIPYEKLGLLPNGVACEDNPFISIPQRVLYKKNYALQREKIAVFIGGGHRPNMEACEMIYKIAPYCKNTNFIFAGNLCNELSKKAKPCNAALLGTVSEETRRHIFSVSDIALNPMYSGSGSNVKMFDYMAMGMPIISSLFGARGISDKSTFHIADTADELIDAIQKFDLLSEDCAVKKARMMIEEKYDWKVIARNVKDRILDYIG